MIDVRDLRIGNYVKLNSGVIIKVLSVGSNYINLNTLGRIEDCEINPILLTPEILEKCGFEYSSNHVYEYKDDENILFDEPNDWNNTKKYPIGIFGGESNFLIPYTPHGEVIIRCKYLHQLQNMYYAVTQKELEVNI